MTPAEITREIDELEGRLERLRIKYDQYFTGIERMIPWVVRKDVDRRFDALHREPMRNTGIRFRFNTLVSRYTSYQTLWGRILRQMEDGTWKRDVVRAQRLGLKPVIRGKRPARPEEPEEISADQLEEIDDAGEMLGVRGDREEIPDSLFGAWQPESSHGGEKLPEGVDFGPTDAARDARDARDELIPVVRQGSAPPSPGMFALPAEVTPRQRPVLSPFGALRAPSPARGVLQETPAIMVQVHPIRETVDVTETSSGGAAEKIVPTRVVAPPPGVVLPPPGVVIPPRPTTGTHPIAGTGVRGAPTRPGARVPTGTQPGAEKPAVRAVTAEREDAATRTLYDRFVEARKQTGENADVRYETVAKQVRESLPRLAEKYPDAEVKLDVTIKDGRAILRPVVTVRKK